MQLSTEDKLRLHVLLASDIQALRIDDRQWRIDAWSAQQGVLSMPLHPNGSEAAYLKAVRDLISQQVLGSAGTYPLLLQRWGRLGQVQTESLAALLLLGEPEAVKAVVHASSLTPELAARAWWLMPDAENARAMLNQVSIAHSELGLELAAYLLADLPFETEPALIADTVRLMLNTALDEQAVQSLWLRSQHQSCYLLGFLAARGTELPTSSNCSGATCQTALPEQIKSNPFAQRLLHWRSPQGRQFLSCCEQVLNRAENQDIVNKLLVLIAERCHWPAAHERLAELDLEELQSQAHACCQTDSRDSDIRQLLQVAPESQSALEALYVLSGLSYAVVRPIFSRSDACGSLMRRKLRPVSQSLISHLQHLAQSALD